MLTLSDLRWMEEQRRRAGMRRMHGSHDGPPAGTAPGGNAPGQAPSAVATAGVCPPRQAASGRSHACGD